MSGGSYDYASRHVSVFVADLFQHAKNVSLPLDAPAYPGLDVADPVLSERAWEARKWLAHHLELVAEAMKAVEWVDSADCSPDDEVYAIEAVQKHALPLKAKSREALMAWMSEPRGLNPTSPRGFGKTPSDDT